ncbi:MAG TPA: cystatin domain-containing protein [Pyrinomonadaceae bacterium]
MFSSTCGYGGVKMKRSLTLIAILSVALFGFTWSIVSAQRTGGYREIDKADEGAAAAAEFAVKAESEKKEITYKLVSIEHAEAQTVAGINYRLCLKVGYHKADDDAETTESVRVVVYRNLQNQYSLTSWTEENCGDDSN